MWSSQWVPFPPTSSWENNLEIEMKSIINFDMMQHVWYLSVPLLPTAKFFLRARAVGDVLAYSIESVRGSVNGSTLLLSANADGTLTTGRQAKVRSYMYTYACRHAWPATHALHCVALFTQCTDSHIRKASDLHATYTTDHHKPKCIPN